MSLAHLRAKQSIPEFMLLLSLSILILSTESEISIMRRVPIITARSIIPIVLKAPNTIDIIQTLITANLRMSWLICQISEQAQHFMTAAISSLMWIIQIRNSIMTECRWNLQWRAAQAQIMLLLSMRKMIRCIVLKEQFILFPSCRQPTANCIRALI